MQQVKITCNKNSYGAEDIAALITRHNSRHDENSKLVNVNHVTQVIIAELTDGCLSGLQRVVAGCLPKFKPTFEVVA